MANTVSAGALLTPGLRAEFARVYAESYLEEEGLISNVIATIPSDKLKEIYGWLLSAPYPARWDRGNMIESGNMQSRQLTVLNRDYGYRIYVHDDDIQDDQTSTIWQQARDLGRNWRSLPVRIFYQYIQNGTDNTLLPAIPNSGDGSALYISTTRYGSSGGNSVSQSGSSTVQQYINDLFSVKQRYIDFQNTQSQPLLDPETFQKNGVHIFIGSSMNQLVEWATNAMLTPLAASTATSNAAISNLVKATGMNITHTVTQRITNTAFYAFVKGLPTEKRPLLRQVRQGFREAQGNFETSDHTRSTKEMYLQFDSREGWGSAEPYATIKVS